MDLPPKTARICVAAQKLAEKTAGFFDVKNAGPGNYATNAFMKNLRTVLGAEMGKDCEVSVGLGNDSTLDFYVAEEKCVVEIALGLHRPSCEYEKDILKCLLAREYGLTVETLVLVGKPGAITKHAQPFRKDVASLLHRKHSLKIIVLELQRPKASAAGGGL
jgi:hypothetical protein